MKKIAVFSLFIVTLLAQMANLSAQNNSIVTTITPKVRLFPSGGFSYLDDPGRYFNIQMVNTSASTKEVYFTISLSCDFTATGQSFFVNTKKEYQPATPISIGVGAPVQLHRNHFDQIIGNLNSNAYETNVDRSQLVNRVFTLPEGQYRFCITPYEWTGHNEQNPVQLGEEVCYIFTICYSGSAPEFTSPVNGFSAGNLNNSNPANNLLGGDVPSSDNRNSEQYTVLPLQRNVNFNWTGVISNCLSPLDFNYNLKIVEVYKNQNIQDAISQNPTLATVDCKSRLSYLHDTMSNRHFSLQRGHVYAAQVQATLKNSLLTEVQLSNNGKSQVIAFVWGDDPVQQAENTNANISSSVSNNRPEVQRTVREPYFVNPGKDQTTITALQTRLPNEASHVPANNANSYVGGAVPYYQVTPSDTLSVQWMPVRGDSVFRVKYIASLYEYVGGEVPNSMNVQPLKTKDIEVNSPSGNFEIDNTTLQALGENWVETLEEGYKYVLNLKSEVFYSYNQKTTYTITEYIHNMPSNHDSIVNEVMFANDFYESNVVFAWGIDSGALDKVYPPEFTYPVDLSQKAWDDDTWTELPEVTKRESFSFRWKEPRGVDYQDSVYYKLKVGELPKGKKPDQVSSFFFTKDSIAETEYIDSVLFDTLKVDKQYVAYVEAWIKQKEDTSAHYNILNKGVSHPATFKLVAPPEFKADLNDKIKCFPKALDDLSKETITPTAESLVNDRVELKMGDFPLVMQTCKYDEEKKVYNGDGYVIWHPLGVDVRLKVKVDSIQINKDHQIIKGSAVSTATDSSLYLDGLVNDLNMDEWAPDDINNIASKLGNNEKIKGYYDSFKKNCEKYAKKYGGIAGALTGGSIQTEVLTFPLSISDEEATGSKNVIFSINDMFFSPTTALMNIWAIFAAQSDNSYVPFLANNVCMDQQGFLGNSSTHIELFMARDYEFELNDGYKMRFKKSSSFKEPKDGTVIIVDTGKLNCMMAQIEFDMNSNDVMGIEKDGTPRKGKVVHANLYTKIKDWDNWVAKITMDPFAVAGADRFTFVPTGKGIFYDHSSSESPKEITFPKDYFAAGAPEDQKPNGGKKSGADEKGGKDGGKGGDKDPFAKDKKEWQGFYWDELTVFLSDEISNTFVDEDLEKKDSVVTYKHGINGTVEDSVHYCYPGSRINFGTKGLIIDKNGFSAEIFVRDIIKAETKSGGGWAFSLDTVSVKFIKNKYKEGVIKGGLGIPLFSGGFKYECSIGADSLSFSIDAAEDTLDLDLWMARVKFDKKSSYFRIQKIYKEKDTRIDLTLNGQINVNFKKIGIPINCPLAKFEHMGMRNYNLGKAGTGTAKCDKFEFDIGTWSFASPQKTIGGAPSDGNGMQVDDKGKPLGSVSFGGFTFSLTDFDPIATFEKTKLKIGFKAGGQIKFATEGTDLGASCGFSVWGIVDPGNKFHIDKVDAKLESISFDKIDFEVFQLDGKLDFFDKTTSAKMGDGFGGSLSITLMSKVTLSMKAGFGTKSNGSSNYTWWYFDGACKFPSGIPLGAVSINGFSGGFAYNMKSKTNLSDFNAATLLKTAEKNTNDKSTKSSGMEYEPSKGSWVANAGISLALTGGENTMNADGLVSLRIANKHFSGIFIDANAYVLSKMDKTKTPGDGSNNSSPLIRAKAIMGFEQTKVYDYFRLSIAVQAKINLESLLEGVSSTMLGSTLSGIHGGSSLLTSSNVTKELDKLGGKSGMGTHTESDRENAASASQGNGGAKPSFNVSASIPIDFELKYYKQKDGNHKKGSTDWYFAIGKPKYSERVQLSADLNMIVCKANAQFTFYMQTGNAFAYQMPPLSKDLQNFFGIEDDGKKMDTDDEGVKSARKLDKNSWLSIDKGGGFCMGSTFHASLSLDFFLYVHVTADLGFDVALLDVTGTGCPGHPQIGKHNFYALGQVYAALQGDVGFKINLGFWKGEFSLFKAGIGALLQGGGPNPSYAYGLLRFKVSMLNGLIKFSTSVDFKLGDVCVPGAGDPLANVKLFQNVTPGFETESAAKTSSNHQSPLQVGTIVSNMPWDREVYLADNDGKNARRFYFTLIEKNIKYQTRTAASGSYTTTTDIQTLKFVPSRDDANTIFFETQEGGFVEGCYNKLILQARGFEWRTQVTSKELQKIDNGAGKDYPYYVDGVNKGTMKSYGSTSTYGWYDPTFYDEKTKKKIVRKFQKDTTFYFKTKELGNDLNNYVVFSWPYNGDRQFPTKEYVHTGSGSSAQPYAMLYLYGRKDNIFDPTTLSNNGKQLKIFLLKYNGDAGDVQECSYTYYKTGSVPYVKIKLPKNEYENGCGPHKLRFLVVKKDAYASAMAAANSAMITQQKAEYSQRISNSTYTEAQNAHNSNVSNSKKTKPTINIKNQQLEEIYDSKKTDGKDSMTYYRTQLKNSYKVSSSIGDCVYEWTWFADFNYKTYGEYFARNLSENCYYGDYEKGRNLNYGKLTKNLQNATVNSYSSYNKITFKSSENYWIFLPYDPQDPKRYNTNCVMPPRFFLGLSNGGDVNLSNMHAEYFQHFIDMERDFKKTPLLSYRYSDNSGDVGFNKTSSATVSDYSLKNELTRILSGGFITNNSASFSKVDLRIKGGTTFTQCAENGYHPTTIDVPTLLDFSSSQVLEAMDDKYFEPQYASRLSIGQSGANCTRTLSITDYATHAIVNDIKMLHDFMQACQQHADAYGCRGWSHKVDYFKDFYSNKYKNSQFTPPGFPYSIPEIYIVTHYMTVLDDLWLGEKNQYYTANGDYLYIYQKDDNFIKVSDLQLKDRMWAQYWWSASGQPVDRGANGFNRDFYKYKMDHKYYNIRSNQANNGKHTSYVTKSTILGSWYTRNHYNFSSLRNNICVYFITAESSNFESNLMKIAQAVKLGQVQSSKIFYPNTVVRPSGCYYNLNLNSTTIGTKLSKCNSIEIKEKNDDTKFKHR